jgi:hypothetical protein
MKRSPALFLPVAAFTVAIAFALYTGHVWEDFFITFRSSANLVHGHGLVYEPGERVQSFTSPLGTLLPAAALWLVGGKSLAGAIWIFRLATAAAWSGAVWLVFQTTLLLFEQKWIRSVTVALVILDAKCVDFSINGMETAFVLLFLLGFVYALAKGGPRQWLWLGICGGGLLWSRPDGFVYAGCASLAWALFGAEASERASLAKNLARGALLAGLLYAPWALFAWRFYGSAVPNTVHAKGSVLIAPSLHAIIHRPWAILQTLVLPPYALFGGWPPLLVRGSGVVAGTGLLAWLAPNISRAARGVSFAAFAIFGYYAAMFVNGVYPAPWYLPMDEVLVLIALGLWLAVASRNFPRATRAVAWGLIGLQTVIFGCTAYQLRIRQRVIEAQRVAVGRYLQAHAKGRDTVFLECLGYMGYYSGLKMLDTPGLAAPQVANFRHTVSTDWPRIIDHFKPDWVVLRPIEAKYIRLSPKFGRFEQSYRAVERFDCSAAIAAHRFLPGRGYLEIDQTFTVYHRQE